MELPKMHNPQPSDPIFIRFGLWSRRSMNHDTHRYEKGVSACNAALTDGVAYLTDDLSIEAWSALDGRCAFRDWSLNRT